MVDQRDLNGTPPDPAVPQPPAAAQPPEASPQLSAPAPRPPTSAPPPAEDTLQRNRRSRRKSALSTGQRNWIIIITALGVAASLATTSAAPTGNRAIDVLYNSALVVLTTLAGSRARRWSLVIAAGLATIGSTTFMMLPPVVALVVASVLAWQDRRDRVLGALIGALVGWSALDLVWPTPTGATALLAAAAVIPLWISGYRVARAHNRRRIRLAVLVYLAVVVIGTAVAGVTVATQRNMLTNAASTTIEAAQSITAETTDEATKKFTEASRRFESASRATGAFWTHPARLVPMVAQNLDAVHQAATAGADITRTATEIADGVDYDRLQLDGGGIDLEVLASFEPIVERAEAVINSVDEHIRSLDSPWIVRPLADKLDEFEAQTGPLRDGAELASLVVNDIPAMLGRDGERRYLMLLGNPAEARDIGGHIGTFAELRAANGALEVERVVTPYELFGPSGLDGPELYDRSVLPPSMLEMNPTRFAQNWGSSPDMNAVAEVARQLYPQTTGGSILDGVLYADPYAFSAVLRLVGGITTTVGKGEEATEVEVDAANAIQFLTHDQFIHGEEGDDPVRALVDTALERLTTRRLPSVRSIIDSFGPVIEQGRIQFVTFHSEDSGLLERTGLDQAFGRPDGGDLFAVIDRSGYPSKIDSYIHREIDYRPRWNPGTGIVNAQVRIAVSNDAPAEGLPPLISLSPEGTLPGTSRTVLSVITPFDIVDASLDGEILPVGTRPEQDDLRRHSFLVDIAPGATRYVVINLSGSVEPGPDYHLRFYNQPLVNPDETNVSITSLGSPFIGGARAGRVPISRANVQGESSGSGTPRGSVIDSGAMRITDLRFRTRW